MGAAIQALRSASRSIVDVPAAAVVVGLFATLLWLVSYATALLPLVGFFVTAIATAFLVGGMYAVANRAASHRVTDIGAATVLIRARWISLLIAYGVLWVVGFVLGIVVLLPLVIVILFGTIAGNLLAIVAGLIVIGAYGSVLYFLFAMVFQFLYPGVAIRDLGAIDSLKRATGLVRSAPLSVAGFTLVRLAIQYVPLLLGGLIALFIGRDVLAAVLAEFEAIVDDPPTDPAAQPDFFEILFAVADTGTIVAMVLLLFLGGTIGEILRIFYLTAFFRSVTDEDE